MKSGNTCLILKYFNNRRQLILIAIIDSCDSN
jgi:hypothetical protein